MQILQFAVDEAREGAATVLGMADGQAGVDYEGRCSCLAWSRTAATAKVDQISAMQGILKTSGQCFGRAFHPKLDK